MNILDLEKTVHEAAMAFTIAYLTGAPQHKLNRYLTVFKEAYAEWKEAMNGQVSGE